jgi:biotin carboxylase/ribosomal protein S18 acetylase RimI-like enzyme
MRRRSCGRVRENSQMRQQHVLFLFGPQVCVPEDPLAAAKEMGLRTSVMARDMPCGDCSNLVDHFEKVQTYEPDEIVRLATKIDQAVKIDAIVSYDDQGVPLAARVGAALGLRGNSIEAADATRSKLLMKQRFAAAGVAIADYSLAADEDAAALWATEHGYPVVVKPVRGSASQAVIRANDEVELRHAIQRLIRIVDGLGTESDTGKGISFLIESYMPGNEVSVELMVRDGTPHVLCIFEKPQPLEGPFFEETIYVTPARLDDALRRRVQALAVLASNAIGLSNGPAHCEIRITPEGPRVLEIAGRLIGGACSRAFRYALGEDIHFPILKSALGKPFEIPSQLPGCAAGAMMLPIPAEGILRAVHGVDVVEQMPGVRDVIMAVELGQVIVPFPEQSCYIGFVTAAGKTTAEVVRILEAAKESVSLELDPVECQTWECEVEPSRPVGRGGAFAVEDLSIHSTEEARKIATDLLARAQFLEFPPEEAELRARECLRQLEAGALGATSPDYWLTAEGRGIVIGARSEDSCYIACLAVLPQFRKRGVGEALLGSLMNRFASQNCSVVKVVVDPRESAAVALYRSLGFQPSDGDDQICCCP